MLNEYYGLRGWDAATGFFKQKTLEDLDLGDLIELLGEKATGTEA